MQTGLRPMLASDLEQVLGWRNHPAVRRYMYSSHEITAEEHRRWFERTSVDARRHLMIFERSGEPLGFVNIGPIQEGGITDWGFYTAPEAVRGTGKLLGAIVLEFSFNKLKLHKLCGEVLAFNEASIGFHQRLGFQKEGILSDQHFDGEKYHDVIRFGLLAKCWLELKRESNNA